MLNQQMGQRIGARAESVPGRVQIRNLRVQQLPPLVCRALLPELRCLGPGAQPA